MATPQLRRVETMKEQLDQVSEEYLAAKEDFDVARVKYEVVREKFASVRRLAVNVLSAQDWWNWRSAHESVQYTGLKMGEAIVDVLETHAYNAASQYWKAQAANKKVTYNPCMLLDQIQESLERGGFEFRTATPMREVNAGLINATNVKKEKHAFQSIRAEEILKDMDFIEGIERATLAKAVPAKKETKPKQEEPDEVPF